MNLNSGLQKISELVYQWKMLLDQDLNKQAQVILSRKMSKLFSQQICFDNVSMFLVFISYTLSNNGRFICMRN